MMNSSYSLPWARGNLGADTGETVMRLEFLRRILNSITKRSRWVRTWQSQLSLLGSLKAIVHAY